MNGAGSRSLIVTASLLGTVFSVIVVAPLVFIYGQSLWDDGAFSLAPYRDVLVSVRQWTLLFRSVGLAFSVACCATVLGVGAGFAVERVARSIRAPLLLVLAMPAVIPQHIMAIAWVDVLGRSGYLSRFVQIAMPGAPPAPGPFNMFGTLFILSMTMFPIPMLATVAALRRFDARYVEAALLTGQSRRAFLGVLLPLLLPTILTGSLTVFVLAISTFAVPSLLQVNTYPVEIHASSLSFEYGAAAAQSLPMIAVCATIYVGWARFVRPRHAWLSGAARPLTPGAGSTSRAAIFLGATLVVSLLFPLVALFLRSLPLRTYTAVWSTAHDEITTGLLVACGAATLLTLLAFALVNVSYGLTWRVALRGAGLFAFVISGPLFALGMIAVWNRPGFPGMVYDSAAILVLACVARYFVLGDIVFTAQRARMTPAMLEAASVLRVCWWRQLLGIVLPLSAPYLLVVWVLSFILALGEVDTAVLLSPPGTSTFAVRLFSLMHYGPDAFVAALSLLTALAVGAIGVCGVIGFRILSRRYDASA